MGWVGGCLAKERNKRGNARGRHSLNLPPPLSPHKRWGVGGDRGHVHHPEAEGEKESREGPQPQSTPRPLAPSAPVYPATPSRLWGAEAWGVLRPQP